MFTVYNLHFHKQWVQQSDLKLSALFQKRNLRLMNSRKINKNNNRFPTERYIRWYLGDIPYFHTDQNYQFIDHIFLIHSLSSEQTPHDVRRYTRSSAPQTKQQQFVFSAVYFLYIYLLVSYFFRLSNAYSV